MQGSGGAAGMMEVDGYSQVERIGQGGLGDVYRARHGSTGATVAIKVLRDVADESVVWHRTRRELTALVSLAGHAHVVRLIELLDLDDGPALVMEYAAGGSVGALMMRRDVPLVVSDAVLIGRHTAAALAAAHDQGIVHRDVKPQNLLIDAYGQVKLCDFGIAAMARSDEFSQRTSALSMRYASPEELDERDVGPPADVYSLGATLLHMARGAPPTLRERLAPWVPPPTQDEDLAALDVVMAACLHPSPDERPTAAAVLSDLERIGWAIDDKHRALVFEPVDLPADVEPVLTGALDRSSSGTRTATSVGDATVVRRADDAARGLVAPVDPTLHRRPTTPPRPEPRPRRRWPLELGAAVIVSLVVAVLIVTWGGAHDNTGRSDADERGEPVADAVTLVPRPNGFPPIESLVWPTGPVGECLVHIDDAFESVDCGQPHDLQRTAAGDLTTIDFPTDRPFDVNTVRDVVAPICNDVFERFVGVAPSDSVLAAPFTAPSAATLDDGDRAYQCWIGALGGRMVGDAAGTGR